MRVAVIVAVVAVLALLAGSADAVGRATRRGRLQHLRSSVNPASQATQGSHSSSSSGSGSGSSTAACPDPVPKPASINQEKTFGSKTLKTCTAEDTEANKACITENVETMRAFMGAGPYDAYKALIKKFVDAEVAAHAVPAADVKSVIPEIKSVGSSVPKIRVDYSGDATRLIDVVRGTVVYKDEATLKAGICRLRAFLDDPANGAKRIQEKNAFEGPPNAAHYADYKINIQLTGAAYAKTICEIQIHLCSLLHAKQNKTVNGGRNGHAIYESARDVEKSPLPAEEKKKKLDELNAESARLYDQFRPASEQAKCDMSQWTADHAMFFL